MGQTTANLELRKHNGTQYGQLIATYAGGSDIDIDEAGTWLIRSSDAQGANNDPTLSVGEVTLSAGSGTIDFRLAESFTDFGLDYAGVVNCDGVVDIVGDPGVHTTLRIYMTGTFTGDIRV
jgi:hypothetical protein